MQNWKRIMNAAGVAGVVAGGTAMSAAADIKISEWMYNDGDATEFAVGDWVEFINTGSSAIDVTGWTVSDEKGYEDLEAFDISSLGSVAPGEVFIVTQDDVTNFRGTWGLLESPVRVLGGFEFGLGRGDSILLENGAVEIDRLDYDDRVAGPRTAAITGTPINFSALGANDASLWVLSEVGDAYGSYEALNGLVGNPGSAVPEPSSLALLGLGGLAMMRRRRA